MSLKNYRFIRNSLNLALGGSFSEALDGAFECSGLEEALFSRLNEPIIGWGGVGLAVDQRRGLWPGATSDCKMCLTEVWICRVDSGDCSEHRRCGSITNRAILYRGRK